MRSSRLLKSASLERTKSRKLSDFLDLVVALPLEPADELRDRALLLLLPLFRVKPSRGLETSELAGLFVRCPFVDLSAINVGF